MGSLVKHIGLDNYLTGPMPLLGIFMFLNDVEGLDVQKGVDNQSFERVDSVAKFENEKDNYKKAS